jgi:hypothetical protein
MRKLPSEVRLKAIEIADALLEEGYDEGKAIRIAIARPRNGPKAAEGDIGSSQLAKTQDDRSLTFFRERTSSISIRADVWDRAINGMLTAQQRLIRAALPHLRKSDAPRIVNIASTEGLGETSSAWRSRRTTTSAKRTSSPSPTSRALC